MISLFMYVGQGQGDEKSVEESKWDLSASSEKNKCARRQEVKAF